MLKKIAKTNNENDIVKFTSLIVRFLNFKIKNATCVKTKA